MLMATAFCSNTTTIRPTSASLSACREGVATPQLTAVKNTAEDHVGRPATDTTNLISHKERTVSKPTIKEMDEQIVRKVVTDAIGAGYVLTVDDYGVKNSNDVESIISDLHAVDQAGLLFIKDGRQIGWVNFIFGECGWDVIQDYTTNLEDVLKGATELADQLSEHV
jgi:hypothetical protein